MNKAYVIQFKESGKIDLFGSLKCLYDEYGGEILKSLSYLYKIDFYLDDYEDERCKIMCKAIRRSAHSKNFM